MYSSVGVAVAGGGSVGAGLGVAVDAGVGVLLAVGVALGDRVDVGSGVAVCQSAARLAAHARPRHPATSEARRTSLISTLRRPAGSVGSVHSGPDQLSRKPDRAAQESWHTKNAAQRRGVTRIVESEPARLE
jgi:hypothetical protein